MNLGRYILISASVAASLCWGSAQAQFDGPVVSGQGTTVSGTPPPPPEKEKPPPEKQPEPPQCRDGDCSVHDHGNVACPDGSVCSDQGTFKTDGTKPPGS